jgi:hypothetical protein
MDPLVEALLSTHPDDPANSRYVVPLTDPEDEAMAHSMADTIYSAMVDDFSDDTTKEQADRIYEQCLIDSRRMLCDGDYADIFEEDGGPPAPCLV